MKNIVMGILIAQIVGCTLSIGAMDYAYAQATTEHVQSVVQLMNEHASCDSDKIVIVPKAFRQGYVQSAVDAGRLFVAMQDAQVVGYKKLFCITDPKELRQILVEEVRCNTAPEVCGRVISPAYDEAEAVAPAEVARVHEKPVTYIYTGADFTHPAHRAKGVNSALMDYALAVTVRGVIEHCRQQKSTHLAMIYGLTQGNAGNKDNVLDGRTHGILAHYIPYVQSIAKALNAQALTECILSRHEAFKPSFDPDAIECKPLPDDQSEPGYGCMIACALEPSSGAQ
jgi:GNAT superfamily N-acetyltransferase